MAKEVWKGVFVEEGWSLIHLYPGSKHTAIHTIHTFLGGPLPRSLVFEFKVGYQPYVISY